MLRAGPFRGVTDTLDPLSARSDRLLAARNARIPDAANGSAIGQRRGYIGAAGALTGRGQAVFHHRRLDGSLDRYLVVGGKLYTWDGAATYTDVTPVGITLHATNPVFITAFFDELVITDGANQPWVYTPDDGSADLIQAFADSRPWTAQGPAVVYSGKVFFILKRHGVGLTEGAQNALLWCEEGDVREGYQQANFDNVWELTQTSSESLTCLVAEEGALVYFRENGIGYITGAVARDFVTAATRDTISSTIGTNAPAAVISVNRAIYFPDLDGKLHRLTVGGGAPDPLWAPMRHAVETTGASVSQADLIATARAGYHEGEQLLLMTLWDEETIYVFDATTGDYQGTWALNAIAGQAGEAVHAMGRSVDADELDTFLILGTRGAGATEGIVWREKTDADPSPWLDTPTAGVAVHTTFEWLADLPVIVADPVRHVIASEVRAQIVDPSPYQSFGLEHVAPGVAGASATIEAMTLETPGLLDVGHATWGLGDDAQGAVLRFRLRRVGEPSTAWGLQQLAVKATPMAADPDGF